MNIDEHAMTESDTTPLAQLEATGVTAATDVQESHKELLAAIAGNDLDTTEKKVARILNLFPETRDSDIDLQLTYWRLYESEQYDGGLIDPDVYRRLTRLTTLARARAKIQNTYHLFKASVPVRQARGTLDRSEREHQRQVAPPTKITVIFADEAGKTATNLVVGSLWCLDAFELFALENSLRNWKKSIGFKNELHFKDIGVGNLQLYMDLVDILSEHLTCFSFKSISTPRTGLKQMNKAIEDLLLHLVVRGIDREHETGRAVLPRTLHVLKDLEEEGADRLQMANLKERLLSAANDRFSGQLHIGVLEAVNSAESIAIQVADLFAASVGRIANVASTGEHPKDLFAARFLSKIDSISETCEVSTSEATGDITAMLQL